jgi:type II secretory pathway pseudopilin PulG
MKNRAVSGSGMFLIELMLGIMIFAIAAAVCLKIFVFANQISTESTELNRAVIAAQSSAECFKATGGDLSKTAALLNKSYTAGDTLTQYYDQDWNTAPHDISSYILEVTRSSGHSGFISGEVTVSRMSGEPIFSIPISVMEVTP